jgi:serine/threonine protein kinase
MDGRSLAAGDLLGDEYVIDRLLGRGGMGAVYRATHRDLGTRVAIKLLLDLGPKNGELEERFNVVGITRTATMVGSPVYCAPEQLPSSDSAATISTVAFGAGLALVAAGIAVYVVTTKREAVTVAPFTDGRSGGAFAVVSF